MITSNQRFSNNPELVNRVPTEINMRRPLQVDVIELRIRQGTTTPVIPTTQTVLQQIQNTRPNPEGTLNGPPRRFSILDWLGGRGARRRRF